MTDREELIEIIEIGIKAHFAAGFGVEYTANEIADRVISWHKQGIQRALKVIGTDYVPTKDDQ